MPTVRHGQGIPAMPVCPPPLPPPSHPCPMVVLNRKERRKKKTVMGVSSQPPDGQLAAGRVGGGVTGVLRRHKEMARHASAAAAVVAVVVVTTGCVVSVTGRVLLPTSAVQPPRDARSEVTNSLGEDEAATGREKGGGGEEREERAVTPRDYLLKSVLDYPPEVQRLLLEDEQDPEITPGFYQGDMAGLSPETLLMNTRVAVKSPEKLWINATVPYVISKLYGAKEHHMILTAMYTLEFLTCIKFVPWDEKTHDYLLIWPVKDPPGCWSFVGRSGGQQILSLQPPDSGYERCFGSMGKPIHELMHALGVFHEQARPDRDEYIDIITENIIPMFIHNFDKQSAENTTFPYKYDYNSIMHYGSTFYSYNRRSPTIVPKDPNATIGQRFMLSKLDCLKLNDVYGCMDNPFDKLKYTNLCEFLAY